MNEQRVNFPLLLLVLALIGGAAALGLMRLDIETDVLKSLPTDERVITDALAIFEHHPVHDQVAVDLAIDRDDADILMHCAALAEERMQASGLFAAIGMGETGAMLPALTTHIVENLALLFTGEELERTVLPRLSEDAVRTRLQQTVEGMRGLEGIGQAGLVAADPLGLRETVLARMLPLAPTPGATLVQGRPLSRDGRHLLITARPRATGSDTATARQLAELFTAISSELAAEYAAAGIGVTVTPVGAYRAALDNEEIIRHDVQLALGMTTAGLALLLLFAFPRPLLGLLTLVPALAGTAMALLVYSLFHSSISILVLGFSGALISIMDDHSITYLLFLDQPQAVRGKHAAREVQAIGGTMALLTTVGAFIVLSFSGFPVFAELGQFTALGFLFAYLFIHFVFPKIFPLMPSAGNRIPPLRPLAEALFSTGKVGAAAAVLLAAVLLFFAKPEFRISLSDMNTVSDATLAADELFTGVWGKIGDRVYLMHTAGSPTELQRHNDRLLARLETDIEQQRLQSTFSPSMIFPGEERGRQNHAAWRRFWTPEKIEQLGRTLIREGRDLGFTAEAFAPFMARLVDSAPPTTVLPPPRYHSLLGITAKESGPLIQFITILPGGTYDPNRFFQDYGRDGKIFDAAHFSTRLGRVLFSTFAVMLLIIAVMVTLLLFLQFLDWRLTLITLTPLVFAFICTLGTLNLIGHPLDIPGLMLTVVIFGMGVDYAIYTVCGCQWYGTINHPSHVLLRSALLVAAASTMIGFGVLCFASHSTLRSVGITSLCGIGYALIGTFLLLPPLLKAHFRDDAAAMPTGPIAARVLHRYRLLKAYYRMFARFKLRYDPLFQDLARMLGPEPKIGRILDIGCGYGLPACWCLEALPGSMVTGIDPDAERVKVAGMAVRERGTILLGAAPDLPMVIGSFDLILLLDILHYLDEEQLTATLVRCRRLLDPGGRLVIRFVIPPPLRKSPAWHFEDWRCRWTGLVPHYRHPEQLRDRMAEHGFVNVRLSPTADSELFWIVGYASEKEDQ